MSTHASGKVAVVTGASAGIGAATLARLAAEGFDAVGGARRLDRMQEVAASCGARALQLDVTDERSVAEFADAVGGVHVLVNNAGMARGMDRLEALNEEDARVMWEVNVLGLMRITRALLPALEASGAGHVINVGSTAGRESYPGGGGYTATKHAVRTLTRTLRMEMLGRPVRVTEIAPGLVETEFSLVRFDGDTERAKKPYERMTPLTAEDVADCVAWAATRPPHVNIDEIVLRPLDQAGAMLVHRTPERP